MDLEQVPTRVAHFLVERLDDDILLYHPGLTKTIRLNDTASTLWELCDGTRSIGDIAELLGHAFPEQRASLRDDIESTLQRFADEGAVTID